MPPLNSARRRAVRAFLSALAGGGLTAAGLGGPLASSALGESTTTTSSTPTAEAPASSQEGQTGTTQQPEQTETTTTTPPPTTTTSETTTTPTTPAPSSAPESAPPSSTTPSTPTTTVVPSTPEAPPAAHKSVPAAEAPTVVLKRKQKPTPSTPSAANETSTQAKGKPKSAKAKGPNNVAASPQMVAAQAGALAALLASSEASAQALSFYRIPLFLLPIYKAAAVQYGVPWQILAAVNEIETDFGSDLSVSTAGAVGWMQFMPSTWLQYGVDALNAGYADPYNPVDAIFAAARYLRAAGAATNLRAAIFSYNHSEEYVESVMLRAKLISSYPKDVIATLTGLIDGRLPVTGKHLSWIAIHSQLPSSSSATAGAVSAPSPSANPAAAPGSGVSAPSPVPGSAVAPSPAAAAAASTHANRKAAHPLQLVELLSAPNASVVAVQDGRITKIGDSRKLGKFLVLRDVYGDVFTYAGLGSIAPTYVLPKTASGRHHHHSSLALEAASTHGPAPVAPASAGTQPLTLHVKTPAPAPARTGVGHISLQSDPQEAPAGMGRARLYAHPGNPDARAAAVANAARKARIDRAGHALPLRPGAVVASGTVLGRVRMPPHARDGHLRFAVRPAGDSETINPGPLLTNWAQLQKALHPEGAKANNALLGATASDVFLLSKTQLERAVLSDPGIVMDACARHEVAAGMVNRRVLAVLAFLSRSGLEPTVGALRCIQQYKTTSLNSDEVDISAINGTPIAGHQGPETITDLTIRTLLTLPTGFVPHEIVSLMRFPGAHTTHANPVAWNRIHLGFRPPARTAALDRAATSTAAHSAKAGRTAPAPVVTTSLLSATQWSRLMERVAALPLPTIAAKPSSAAIPDPKPKRR